MLVIIWPQRNNAVAFSYQALHPAMDAARHDDTMPSILVSFFVIGQNWITMPRTIRGETVHRQQGPSHACVQSATNLEMHSSAFGVAYQIRFRKSQLRARCSHFVLSPWLTGAGASDGPPPQSNHLPEPGYRRLALNAKNKKQVKFFPIDRILGSLTLQR